MASGVRTYSPATTTTRPALRPLRIVDLLVGTVLLVLALPVMAVLALAVRQTSTGPILHRERTRDHRGRPVVLLSFRVTVDGGLTAHHARVSAAVGRGGDDVTTGVGRLMRATRTDRLPRLLNVLRGDASLF